jgi:hypothetical protein
MLITSLHRGTKNKNRVASDATRSGIQIQHTREGEQIDAQLLGQLDVSHQRRAGLKRRNYITSKCDREGDSQIGSV